MSFISVFKYFYQSVFFKRSLVFTVRQFHPSLKYNLNINYLELWICLVLHPPLVHYKKEKFDIFLRFSTDYFIELFEIIISRIVEVEAKLICETNVLKYLEAAVFDNNMFNTIFQYYNTPMSGYMDLIRSRLLNIISKESEEHNQVCFYDLYLFF